MTDAPAPPKVVTFGCRLNAYESEVIRGHARRAKLDNTIIINTCAVTQEATRQARQAIRRTRREQPDARIVVTGCAAQIDPQSFADMAEVDYVLGNQEKMRAQNYADIGLGLTEPVRVNDIMSIKQTAAHMIDGLEGRVRAFVQIQNGCDHRCTFCIIPYGRGNSRSVPAGALVEQVRRLVRNGCPEIVLTGVDLTAYGRDLPGDMTLGLLVDKILRLVPALARLRLSSIDAVEVDELLFHLITQDDRVMPHLHLSLQSGDNLILKRMKRRHSRDDAIDFCTRLRHARPEIALGADLIVGFPTETDEMFANTLSLVDACGLTWLHVFPFSARDGTPAADMPPVPGALIKQRAARLRQKGQVSLQAHLQTYVNCAARALMESPDRGRLDDYSPVRLEGDTRPAGSTIRVQLTGQDGQSLWGHVAA